MSSPVDIAPLAEQEICVKCGFCCDGTLFLIACLDPGERGGLPGKIEQVAFSEEGEDYFRQPCNYFTTKCTIYDRPRAKVCGAFRCQLLKDFAANKLTLKEAETIVDNAMKMRDRLLEQYGRLSGKSEKICFRQLLGELGRIQGLATEKEPVSMEYDILLAGCNIFEALMVKHMRSASDFEKMKIRE
jgi:hypothetical protein